MVHPALIFPGALADCLVSQLTVHFQHDIMISSFPKRE